MTSSLQKSSIAAIKWVGVIALAFAGASCQRSQPRFVYMPDMVYSPAIKAQEIGGSRLPVAGTVARNAYPYHYKTADEAGAALKNPIKVTRSSLNRGQHVYSTYCLVCHGDAGLGNGPVIGKFPMPPSLQSDKIRNAPDGFIFHITQMGQSTMPSYASQISAEDRWAAIHYIRALQRSKNPSPDDLKAVETASR